MVASEGLPKTWEAYFIKWTTPVEPPWVHGTQSEVTLKQYFKSAIDYHPVYDPYVSVSENKILRYHCYNLIVFQPSDTWINYNNNVKVNQLKLKTTKTIYVIVFR